jgi:RNA polymerase sigma-B factor
MVNGTTATLEPIDGGDVSASDSLLSVHREYLRTQDPHLCEQLVAAHQHLAVTLARRMSRRTREREDVVQVAMLGLLKAINRFDPDRGVSFGTFAWRTIEGEVKRYYRDSSWTVHVPRSLQERSVMISNAIEELTHDLGRSPMVGDIASALNLTEEEVIEVSELQRACRSVSLDVSDDDDEVGAGVQVGGEDSNYSLTEDRQILSALVSTLPQREQTVVRLRFVEQLTQTEIASRIGVSQMHVSRLLARSLAQLRERSTSMVGAPV